MLSFFSILAPRKVFLIAAIALAAMLALYIWTSHRTIENLRSELVLLEIDKAQLTTAVNTQNNTITFLRNQARLVEQEYRDTEQAFADARRDAENLKKQLDAHELDILSVQSYNASEVSINNTTAKISRCYELLSGAPLNETETTATTSQEFNYMCPWLFAR